MTNNVELTVIDSEHYNIILKELMWGYLKLVFLTCRTKLEWLGQTNLAHTNLGFMVVDHVSYADHAFRSRNFSLNFLAWQEEIQGFDT